MYDLYIIRGLPGSGKTTFAEQLGVDVYSADDYFTDAVTGEYNFDMSKLYLAHKQCQRLVKSHMELGEASLAVANTSTTVKELKPYYKLAEGYGYRVFSVVVENRHGGVDVHNVPAEILKNMRNRFNVEL